MYKVIIIDDEVAARKGFEMYLNAMNDDFEVEAVFEDGMDAIEYLKNHHVDVVITDIRMAEVSGIEVAKYIYKNKPDIKTIMISAYEDFEYARSAVEYKVERILTKPTSYSEFVNVMKEIKSELIKDAYHRNYRESVENLSEVVYRYALAEKKHNKTSDRIELLSAIHGLSRESAASAKYQLFDIEILDYDRLLNSSWLYGKESFNILIKNFFREYLLKIENRIKIYQIDIKENTIKYIAYSGEYNAVNYMKNDLFACLSGMADRLMSEFHINAKIIIKESYESIYNLLEEGHEHRKAEIYDITVIDMAKKYIEEHYFEDISLYDLGKHVNMNSAYLSRIFKQKTGKNFLDYLTDIRIERAKEIIRSGRFKVSEIASAVGYRSVSYFGKIFKSITGYTPREYYLKEAISEDES